jgi:protein-tyrosine phosphatase
MTTKIYWLHTLDNKARLGIMARPRGNDWLEDEMQNLKNKDVGVLVSLLERDEIVELRLQLEAQLCTINGIDFINFPIADREIPQKNDKIDQLIDALKVKLDSGLSVAIHCRMGIGRSSIIAAAILLNYGTTTKDIIEHISSVRGLQVPDTDEQIQWLKNREK